MLAAVVKGAMLVSQALPHVVRLIDVIRAVGDKEVSPEQFQALLDTIDSDEDDVADAVSDVFKGGLPS